MARGTIASIAVTLLLFLVLVPPLITVLYVSSNSTPARGEKVALWSLFIGFASNCVLMFWGWVAVLLSPSIALSRKLLWAVGILFTGAICASIFLLRSRNTGPLVQHQG
jgi:hypothetical protein